MSAKASKLAKSSSNQPLSLPTRLKSPRASTTSHHSLDSVTDSISSRQSNTSSKRKKHRRSQPSVAVDITTSAHRDRSPSSPASASSCVVSDTPTSPHSTVSMAQITSRPQGRNRDSYKLNDKSDTKHYDILADIDDFQDHGRPSSFNLSLFEAAHELRRRNVTVKGISLQALQALQNTNPTPNTPGRADRNPLSFRQETPTFPDHLLNLSSDPSIQDIALKTVLNAGAIVDFNAAPYGSASPSSSMHQCFDCDTKFSSPDELDEHTAWEDRWCSHCKKRFECRGTFGDHPCALAIRGGSGLLGGSLLGGGGRRKNIN